MLQSSNGREAARLHIAIIMDGNGRWAIRRGLPRVAGHRAGAKAVRRVVEAARRLDVATLTLFAFSSDNWQRPLHEVNALMRLFCEYLASETERCMANDIRLSVIGRRDRLTIAVQQAIAEAETATAGGAAMHLRIAVDYSARDSILEAGRRLAQSPHATQEEFARLLGQVTHTFGPAPDVDLLIRTSGEQRLSDFLLWECAYAELVFTDTMWPDFDEHDLQRAISEYHTRERRFGRVSHVAAG